MLAALCQTATPRLLRPLPLACRRSFHWLRLSPGATGHPARPRPSRLPAVPHPSSYPRPRRAMASTGASTTHKSFGGSLSVAADDKLVSGSAMRNIEPIAEQLGTVLGGLEAGKCLEIASGCGQHIAHFGKTWSALTWQPSDCDERLLRSIRAYVAEADSKSILAPVTIDVTADPSEWPVEGAAFDLVFNANMIHISPVATLEGLMRGAGHVLKAGGKLVVYGPFAVDGKLTPESNVRFDESLKQRDPRFGIRDLADVDAQAAANGLQREQTVEMPSNNKLLIFTKGA